MSKKPSRTVRPVDPRRPRRAAATEYRCPICAERLSPGPTPIYCPNRRLG